MAYITLKDIAERTGVSINTVSRALKDKPDIGADTKRRIRETAEALGYVPNATASNLRARRSKTIGVVVTHLDNAFYARILQGINDAISDSVYTIITLSSNEDLGREGRIIHTLYANRVAGLIIVPARDLVSDIDYDTLKVPHITIVRKGSLNTSHFFITDSRMSGRLAAEKIAGEGRRHPGYIGYTLPVSCNTYRLDGFREELSNRGLPLPGNRVLLCDSTADAAYEAARSLLTSRCKVDSLFVYNDHMAFGVLRALHEAGIRVPDDISVMGHDDITEARFHIPSLSSIRVPKYELGFESASCLMDILEGKQNISRRVIYNPEPVIRET